MHLDNIFEEDKSEQNLVYSGKCDSVVSFFLHPQIHHSIMLCQTQSLFPNHSQGPMKYNFNVVFCQVVTQ